MRLKKAFRDADVGSLEKRVIYSSDFLHKLFAYLQHEYGAYIESFPVTVFEKIRVDQAIIGLFCQIMKKRMFIIDDMEF